MDLVITAKAYTQGAAHEGTRARRRIVDLPFQRNDLTSTISSTESTSHIVGHSCQECIHPNGKPITVLIQNHAPTLCRDSESKTNPNDLFAARGRLIKTYEDTVLLKWDTSGQALMDCISRLSDITLPGMQDKAHRVIDVHFCICIGDSEEWEVLREERLDLVKEVLYGKEASVKLRLRAFDVPEGWEERERERLLEEERREEEWKRKQPCVVM